MPETLRICLKKSGLIVLVLVFIAVCFPGYNLTLAGEDPSFRNNIQVRINNELIRSGQKGVDFNQIAYIDVILNPGYSLISPLDLHNIRVMVNGHGDDTGKFDIKVVSGFIRIISRDNQLRKQAIYNLHIPAGVFKNNSNSQPNDKVDFYFVTSTDEGTYRQDILRAVTPANNAVRVDNKNGQIVFEFIDDIVIDQDTVDNISKYIEIKSQRINNNIPGYNTAPSYNYDDSIANYDVKVDKVEKNKLVLKVKGSPGYFKDFARYTVRLKNNTVYLEKPSDKVPGLKIYNQEENNEDHQVIKFSTDNMLSNTYPANNQEEVEVEPTIKFNFKYPVEFNEQITPAEIKKYISIDSEAGQYALDMPGDISISSDGKTLEININDNAGDKQYPLRRNTLYQVNIKANLLRFVDYPIFNGDWSLYFITGNKGGSPVAKQFSSDPGMTDDIRYLDKTKLNNPKPDQAGSIYIKFDRPIRADRQSADEYLSLRDGVKLYQMPGTMSTNRQNGTGAENMAFYLYPAVGTAASQDKIIPDPIPASMVAGNYDILEAIPYMKEISVAKAEIIQPDILKITPRYPLANLNKYKLLIDKRVIEDENGYNLEKELSVTLWTEQAADNSSVKWLGPDSTGIRAENIKKEQEAPFPSYTLYGTPVYGPDKPLRINIEGEIIPDWRDEVLNQGSLKTTRISYDGLKKITLVSTHVSDKTIAINRFKLEPYYDQGKKFTCLSLYPAANLDKGKNYSLNIPAGTFTTRSQHDLGALQISFVVEGDSSAGKGTCGLEKGTYNVRDFLDGEEELVVLGYNFTENNVEQVILTPIEGKALNNEPILIKADNIFFYSLDKVVVKLRGTVAANFTREDFTGIYQVSLKFSDNYTIYPVEDKFILQGRGRPSVKATSPTGNELASNSSQLESKIDATGSKRYFLKVTFADLDGTLIFNYERGLENIKESTVVAEGSNLVAILDLEFINSVAQLNSEARYDNVNKYFFVKDTSQQEAYLYIPVKLSSGQNSYTIRLNENIVKFRGGEGNDIITWSFSTIAATGMENILVRSIGENYNTSEPILLKGDFYIGSTPVVKFNDIRARQVNVKTEPEGQTYLEVYLPSGSDRLKPGLYNITVEDGSSNQVKFDFSVVKKADKPVPQEGQKIIATNREGDIIKAALTSQDTLELDSKYTDRRYVELNLDELMGEKVWERKITFTGYQDDKIGELRTLSRWANISLYGVTLDASSRKDDIEIRLGRAPASLTQSIKISLRNKNLKSDFIEAAGENLGVERVELTIPYRQSDGRKLKAFRYDSKLRRWYEVSCLVNQIDRNIRISSPQGGIFVAVE